MNNITKLEILLISVIFCLPFISLVRDLDFSRMWAFADLMPFPLNLSHRLEESLYIQSNEGLGGLTSPMHNIIRFNLFLQCFLDANISQKVVIFLPFIIGFFSFYVFLREFEFSPTSCLMGGFLYAFNPITFSSFIVGAVGSLMVLGIFPLFTLCLNKFLFAKMGNIKYLSAICIFAYLFFWNVYFAFWFLFLIFIFLFLINIITVRFSRQIIFAVIKRIVLLSLFFTLIFLPNLIVLYLIQQGTVGGNIIKFQADYSYEDATFLNLIRLAGNKGSPQVEGYLNYNTFTYYAIFGYVLSFISFGSLLFRKNNQKFILVMVGCLVLLLTIGCIVLIKEHPYVVEINAFLSTLRNPSKLMLPMVFFFSIMFAYSIETVTEELPVRSTSDKKLLATVLIILSFASIFLYNLPVLDGTLGVERMEGSVYIPIDYRVDENYYNLASYLMNSEPVFSDFYVLYFPWERFSRIEISRIIPTYFGVGASQGGIMNTVEFSKDFFEVIDSNPPNKDEFLKLFNIRYIVIDKKFKGMYTTTTNTKIIYDNMNFYWYSGSWSTFYSFFENDDNFALIYEDEEFAVFKNKNLSEPHEIYSIVADNEIEESILKLNITSSEHLLFYENFDNFSDTHNNFKIVGPYQLVTEDMSMNYSMALYSTGIGWSHIYKSVSIPERGWYRLNFFIKGCNITNLHTKILWYNITQSDYTQDEGAMRVDYIRIYEKKLTEGEWYHIDEKFLSPKNATCAIVVILGSQAKSYSMTSTCVDNISFSLNKTCVNINKLERKVTTLKYVKTNPTLYSVETNATCPFILTFVKSYDPYWVCYVNGERASSFPLYGGVNGFLINQTGQLEITIEYEPQRWFYIGSAISVTTLIACTTYLTHDWTKNKNILKRVKKWLRSNSS